jgi:3-phosphoglycerate kinase
METLLDRIPQITSLDLKGKRIFLRADLNVPIKDGIIQQDHRLQAILPTIKYIKEKGGKIILATHIGRPKAQSQTNFFDEHLSTEILLQWFENKKYSIELEYDLKRAKEKSMENIETILLLENLRFYNGEQATNDEFAKMLAGLADIYINDAFGVMHRNNTSVSLLANHFESGAKSCGLLVVKEIEQLTRLTSNPEQPFTIVIGGNKISDKIAMLLQFLEQPNEQRIKSILVGGAIANTFLKSQNYNIGASLYEKNGLPIANRFLQKAAKYDVNIFLPVDVKATAPDLPSPQSFMLGQIPENAKIIDIGLQTIQTFGKELGKAKTILVNGTMGIYEEPGGASGTMGILKAIPDKKVFSLVAGGDCVAAAHKFNCTENISFLSTGGGATLAFLSSQKPEETMPGLASLLK